MSSRHDLRIRSVYPRRRAGAIDAIAAYNRLLVEALDRIEGVEGTAGEPRDMLGNGCDALLIQYNPFSYGRWGLAPMLVVRLARCRRHARSTRLTLVVHEPYVAPTGAKTAVLAVWHRIQLVLLTCLVDTVVVPSADAARRVGRRPRRPIVVPVGSNIPDRRRDRDAARRSLSIAPDDVVLVAFGASSAGRSPSSIAAAAQAVMDDAGRPVTLLLLGSGLSLPRPIAGAKVIAPGPQSADDLARLMAAGDVFLAPYDDGVSTRRGALMAALQHGLAVVGTDAGHSDAILVDSRGLRLVAVDDDGAFAAATVALARDEDERRTGATAARELYQENFDWDVVATRMLGLVTKRR